MRSGDDHIRRVRLVEFLFEEYVPTMPDGTGGTSSDPVPPKSQWPDGFAEGMAELPSIIDLDAAVRDLAIDSWREDWLT